MTVTVEAEVVAKTSMALMFEDCRQPVWIPFSQIVEADFDGPDEVEVGDKVTFEIPRWLAQEKGLVE